MYTKFQPLYNYCETAPVLFSIPLQYRPKYIICQPNRLMNLHTNLQHFITKDKGPLNTNTVQIQILWPREQPTTPLAQKTKEIWHVFHDSYSCNIESTISGCTDNFVWKLLYPRPQEIAGNCGCSPDHHTNKPSPHPTHICGSHS